MMESKFGEEVRIPSLPPAQPAFAFARAKREAVYVGGYYLKLQRSVIPFLFCCLTPFNARGLDTD